MARGARGDASRGPGPGLAIVEDPLRFYGGEVGLEDSPLGGVRALWVLPAAAYSAPPRQIDGPDS